MNRYQNLISRAKKGKTILMDGATGTEAERRGVPQLKNAWNGGVALTHPEILKNIHEDYIRSGSEIIISNTFANTKHALEDANQGHNFEKFNREGLRIAIETRDQISEKVLVAGGISYWTWTGRKPTLFELGKSVEIQAKIMEQTGADLILLEMMVDIEKMLVTLNASQQTKLPIWVGLSCFIRKDGQVILQNGNNLEDVINQLNDKNIDVIFIMHTEIEDILPCLIELRKYWNGMIGVYPHTGSYNNQINLSSTEWAFQNVIITQKFIQYAQDWKKFGVDFIGGCCGIGVKHIEELAKIIK